MNRFRKYLAVVCTLIMIGASCSAFANFIVTTPDQVVVSTDGLFVDLDGTLQPVESITMANDGHVVAISKPQAWYCKDCSRHVPYPVTNGPGCGRSNPRNQGQ